MTAALQPGDGPSAATIRAAELLAAAWRSHTLVDGLPAACQPTSLDEAHAIQEAVIGMLGETVAGWKAGALRPARGAILGPRLHASPARIAASSQHLRVVEGEIAFVFHADMPPQAQDYSREAVTACVSPCAAIEVVDSRYRDFPGTGDLDRIADLFSNGALVCGPPVRDWAGLDLGKVKVTLAFDGRTVLAREGGHSTGDPLGACVMLVNSLRTTTGVRAGQVVTAGTYTGAKPLHVGSTAIVQFEGLGAAEVTFTA